MLLARDRLHDVDLIVEQLAQHLIRKLQRSRRGDIRDPHARSIYERDLVLIRPDQNVAWRAAAAPADPPRS